MMARSAVVLIGPMSALVFATATAASQVDPVAPPVAPATSAQTPATAPPPAGQDDGAPDVDQLAVDRDRYERMTVPVTISGHGPYRFLVDTGAQATVVTHRVTEPLKLLPTGRAMLVAMGSAQMVETIDIDDLAFANRSFSGITAPLLKADNVGADGIIGLDSLQGLKVVIDFLADRISVTDAPLARASSNSVEIVVHARRRFGQMIITDARIDGIRTAIVIDTGSQTSFANQALRDRLRSRDKGQASFESVDVNGSKVATGINMVRELKIGAMTMRDVPMGFHESPVFAALGLTHTPAIILGMQNLRPLNRVAIDFANRRVLFDLPASMNSDRVRTIFSASRIKDS